VNWNQSDNTVYIQGNSGPANVANPPPATAGATNVINRLSPAPNTHVAGSASILGGVVGVATGTNTYDATAGASGRFAIPVSINAVSAGSLHIALTSTSPAGAVAQRTIAYST